MYYRTLHYMQIALLKQKLRSAIARLSRFFSLLHQSTCISTLSTLTTIIAHHHLCGTIELHGTRPQGNHRVNQGQIFVLQVFHVTHYVGFRVVPNNIHSKFLNEFRCNIENKTVNLFNNRIFFVQFTLNGFMVCGS